MPHTKESSFKPEGVDGKLLSELLSEPTITYGEITNVIKAFEKARGTTLFLTSVERERTATFCESLKDQIITREAAVGLMEMLQADMDRAIVEGKKVESSETEVEEKSTSENGDSESRNKKKKTPPTAFNLQERRRTSNEHRIRGSNDGTSSEGSGDEIDNSLVHSPIHEEGGMNDDSGIASSSRSASRTGSIPLKTPPFAIQTQIPISPSMAKNRSATATGVSFPRESITSPPPPSSFRTPPSGVPRLSRQSDPPKPPQSGSRPPSSFGFSPGSINSRSGRARSGSVETGSSRNSFIQSVPLGASGMGVPYSAGITGAKRNISAGSRRTSQETIITSPIRPSYSGYGLTSSTSSSSSYPDIGINRPRPPRQTSSQRSQGGVAFPPSISNSSSINRSDTPGSPDLNKMKLPDVSLIGDQSFDGELSGYEDEHDTEYIQTLEEIARMGRESISDTTMGGQVGMHTLDDGDGDSEYFGNGTGARKRKISDERQKRLKAEQEANQKDREDAIRLISENQDLSIRNRGLIEKLAAQENDHELIQVRVVDLEIALEDEVSEKRRLERELKQKGRENQAAIAALETKLAMTEERLEQNKTNLTGTSSLNGKLKDEIQELMRTIGQKERELRKYREEELQYEEDKEAFSSEIRSLTTQLASKEDTLVAVQENNQVLKEELEACKGMEEKIRKLERDLLDLLAKPNASHVRGDTENSAGFAVTDHSRKAKRKLAEEAGFKDGSSDDDDDDQTKSSASSTSQRTESDGLEEAEPLPFKHEKHQRGQRPKSGDDKEESNKRIDGDYRDAPTSKNLQVDAFSQTDESQGVNLPPYSAKSEDQVIAQGLIRAHPKLTIATQDMFILNGTTDTAKAYVTLRDGTGMRCEVFEQVLEEQPHPVKPTESKKDIASSNQVAIQVESPSKSKGGYIQALTVGVIAISIGWLVTSQASFGNVHDLDRYHLVHDMANLGQASLAFVPGSVVTKTFAGGARYVAGNVPM